jgi:hypothetical protein
LKKKTAKKTNVRPADASSDAGPSAKRPRLEPSSRPQSSSSNLQPQQQPTPPAQSPLAARLSAVLVDSYRPSSARSGNSDNPLFAQNGLSGLINQIRTPTPPLSTLPNSCQTPPVIANNNHPAIPSGPQVITQNPFIAQSLQRPATTRFQSSQNQQQQASLNRMPSAMPNLYHPQQQPPQYILQQVQNTPQAFQPRPPVAQPNVYNVAQLEEDANNIWVRYPYVTPENALSVFAQIPPQDQAVLRKYAEKLVQGRIGNFINPLIQMLMNEIRKCQQPFAIPNQVPQRSHLPIQPGYSAPQTAICSRPRNSRVQSTMPTNNVHMRQPIHQQQSSSSAAYRNVIPPQQRPGQQHQPGVSVNRPMLNTSNTARASLAPTINNPGSSTSRPTATVPADVSITNLIFISNHARRRNGVVQRRFVIPSDDTHLVMDRNSLDTIFHRTSNVFRR